jgi:UDP-2-acetamido-3-amino-2,3-dideoxy-glucuronate N-acetyltransferase
MVMVHPTSIVEAGASIGAGTFIGPFCHVRSGAVVGADCVIGQGCSIAGSVRIGDRTRVQNGVSIFDGVSIDDEVFLGPSCVFTNVREPRAIVDRRGLFAATVVRTGVTVGANATVLPGVTLHLHAFIGAGAVVTADVRAYEQVVGTPARVTGYRSRHGALLVFANEDAVCTFSGWRYRREDGGVRCLDAEDSAPLGARVLAQSPKS